MRSVWKKIDFVVNSIALKLDRNKHSRWLAYSFVYAVFGIDKIRADYVQFTANRWNKNIREMIPKGFQPTNWSEASYEYFYRRLIEAGFKD